MLKLISLSKVKRGNSSSIEAKFSVDGNLLPLRIEQEDQPSLYHKIVETIGTMDPKNADENAKLLYGLMSPEASIKSEIKNSLSLSGNVEVKDGHVFFGKHKLEDELSEHILSLLDDNNTPKDEVLWKGYVRFLDNLYQNVNGNIRKQLFKWMLYEREAGYDFGITSDGCILGYKGCEGSIFEPVSKFTGEATVDGVDYVGQIPNRVGSVVTMPRSSVEFDPNKGCAAGLHVGTREYASQWAEILLLVKVNPRDVVSVPYECESQKMRVCEYTIVEVVDNTAAHKRFVNVEPEKPKPKTEIENYEKNPTAFLTLNLGEELSFTLTGGDILQGVIVDVERHSFAIDTFTDGYIEIQYEDVEDVEFVEDEDVKTSKTNNENLVPMAVHIRDVKINDLIIVEYDGKTFEGTLSSIYGDFEGLIIRSKNGTVKHIKDYRITLVLVYVETVDEAEEEITLANKIRKIRVGDVIYVEYDGKDFEGEVSSIYGDHEGIIIRSGYGEVKHIKDYRITYVEFLNSECNSDCDCDCECENDCEDHCEHEQEECLSSSELLSEALLKDVISAFEINDKVFVKYEDKEFEGTLVGIYKDYEGLIIRSKDDTVKHIKVKRINFAKELTEPKTIEKKEVVVDLLTLVNTLKLGQYVIVELKDGKVIAGQFAIYDKERSEISIVGNDRVVHYMNITDLARIAR